MTAQELAAKSADVVRKDEKLMGLYIEKYKDLFGFEPNCAPCTFTNDFAQFQKRVRITNGVYTPQNQQTMANTFKLKLKHRNDILTYRVGQKPFRSYGYKMTEEFAKEFLKHGTKAQIKEREELFEELPKTPKKAVKKKTAKSKAVEPEKEEVAKEVPETAKEEAKEDTLPRKKTGRKKNS
jgi:hypothetical protein